MKKIYEVQFICFTTPVAALLVITKGPMKCLSIAPLFQDWLSITIHGGGGDIWRKNPFFHLLVKRKTKIQITSVNSRSIPSNFSAPEWIGIWKIYCLSTLSSSYLRNKKKTKPNNNNSIKLFMCSPKNVSCFQYIVLVCFVSPKTK